MPTHTTPLTPAAAASASTDEQLVALGPVVVLEVAVRVDPARRGRRRPPATGAHSLRRGNSGAAFSTGRPPG